MKIIIYSDLHLEFGSGWMPPKEVNGDLMILAGDIITFKNFRPLNDVLQNWKKPVLYIPGNHEYYTGKSMNNENVSFRSWLTYNHPQVKLLIDESISINGVHFFGGTMWTDFNNRDFYGMEAAQLQMSDFRFIRNSDRSLFEPADAITLHEIFVKKLIDWFEKDLNGPHVVISHHAPVINPQTRHRNSPLFAAFHSLDMLEIIERYQPDLWVYGHTHECDEQMIGQTRIISNPLGYPKGNRFECQSFDDFGAPVIV